jgi:hypothetical protein
MFNGTGTQGLLAAVARPVVTQAVVSSSTKTQLNKGLSIELIA